VRLGGGRGETEGGEGDGGNGPKGVIGTRLSNVATTCSGSFSQQVPSMAIAGQEEEGIPHAQGREGAAAVNAIMTVKQQQCVGRIRNPRQ